MPDASGRARSGGRRRVLVRARARADLVEAGAAVDRAVVPRLERHHRLAAAAVADGRVVLARSRPDSRSARAWPPPGTSGIAAGRSSAPCWRRTPARLTRRRTTRRNRGKSACGPGTPLEVLPLPTTCKLRTGVGGRHGVAGGSALGRRACEPGTLCAEDTRVVKRLCPRFGNRLARARRPSAMSIVRSTPLPRACSSPSPPLACTGASSPTAAAAVRPRPAAPSAPPASPAAIPSSTASPTRPGPTDIVLRLDEAGGFVPVEFIAAHLPYFTLYGDGTVVFAQTDRAAAEPDADGVFGGYPLAHEQADRGPGPGPARVRDHRRRPGRGPRRLPEPARRRCADRGVQLNADGGSKTVSVVALGMEGEPGPGRGDQGSSLAELGNRLKDFDARRLAGERRLRADRVPGGAARHGRRRRRSRSATGRGRTSRSTTSPFPTDPNALPQGTRDADARTDRRRSASTGSRTGSQSGLYGEGHRREAVHAGDPAAAPGRGRVAHRPAARSASSPRRRIARPRSSRTASGPSGTTGRSRRSGRCGASTSLSLTTSPSVVWSSAPRSFSRHRNITRSASCSMRARLAQVRQPRLLRLAHLGLA